MTSEWFCWSWDMHRFMLIYLPTLLLLLKELSECKSSNEKRYWTAKACRTYYYLTWKKGKRPKLKLYDAQKALANSLKWNIKSFWHRSHNEMYWVKKIKWYVEHGAKWKASKILYSSFFLLWEVIYVYFYNWDGSHYLVLVVYALIELIIETSR